MASAPVFASKGVVGSAQLLPGDTTTAKAIDNFTPTTNGYRLKQVRVTSGGVAPGGVTKVRILLVCPTTGAVIMSDFAMTNTADLLQYLETFDVVVPSGYSIQVQTATTLAASSALNFLFFGEDLT